MGKSTISMAMFHCFLYVHQAGYHSWLNSILPWSPMSPMHRENLLDLSRLFAPWICFKCSVDSDDSALRENKNNTSDHILRYPSNSHCVCCVCWWILPIWNYTIKIYQVIHKVKLLWKALRHFRGSNSYPFLLFFELTAPSLGRAVVRAGPVDVFRD